MARPGSARPRLARARLRLARLRLTYCFALWQQSADHPSSRLPSGQSFVWYTMILDYHSSWQIHTLVIVFRQLKEYIISCLYLYSNSYVKGKQDIHVQCYCIAIITVDRDNFHVRNVRAFNFHCLSNWRKNFSGENFLIYGISLCMPFS